MASVKADAELDIGTVTTATRSAAFGKFCYGKITPLHPEQYSKGELDGNTRKVSDK